MTLHAKSLGKKFKRRWIFRNLNAEFRPGDPTAILGPNGSGKSTFLKVASGQLGPDEGKIALGENPVPYNSVNFLAPYIDLPEEFTFLELLDFHGTFRRLLPGISRKDIPARCGLDAAAALALKEYSSGMRQRVKIALALFHESELLLLDEPCSHLDENGVEWFNAQLEECSPNRIVLIGSNDKKETRICRSEVNIVDFK